MKEVSTMTTQPHNKILMAAILLAGSFIAILNQTLMITAIPPIMDEMNVTANSAQWLTTVFMLVNGVMIPVTAFLIERFTTRQLFMTAMSVFAIGTIAAGVAPNFGFLLFGRVIQSAGAGIMMPLMQTVFLFMFPVNKRGTAMGYVGLVISFAPAIGPTLSGWITSHYSWRFLFIFIFPLAILIIVIAHFVLKNVTELTYPKLDIPSIILSSIGFGGLLLGFSNAGNYGWASAQTYVVLIVGVISLLVFIFRQLQMKHPMLEFRVFKFRIFTVATILGMITFLGLIGTETLIPLYMQNMRGYTALDSGLVLLPGAIISGLMSPITGRIFDKFGARILSITGFIIVTIGTVTFGFLGTATTMLFIMIMYAIRMFGFSMVMMPVTTAGLNQLPPKLIPHGTAMNNTMRQIAASIGTAILVTTMTTVAQKTAQSPAIENPEIHGVNVAFFVITAISIVGIVLAFFIKKTSPPTDEEYEKMLREKQQA